MISEEYINPIVIPIFVSIFSLSLPLILDTISKIGAQYKSPFIVKVFQKEFLFKLLLWMLGFSIVSIVLYIVKIPVIDYFSDCYLISNSAVLLLYLSVFLLLITLFFLFYRIRIYFNYEKLFHLLERRYKKKKKTSDFLALSKIMNYSINNADEDLARKTLTFFTETFVNFRKGKNGEEIVYPEEFYSSIFEANELMCARQKKTFSYYNDGSFYGLFIDSFQGTKISERTMLFMWRCVLQNASYNKFDYIFSLWKKIYQHTILFLDNRVSGTDEKDKFIEFAQAMCSYILYLGKYELLVKMINYSQVSPPRHILIPKNIDDIIDQCTKIIYKNNIKSPNYPIYFEKLYPQDGAEGVYANEIIEGRFIDYFSVLFISLFNIKLTIYNGYSLDEKRKKLKSLNHINKAVEGIYNNKELLDGLKKYFNIYSNDTEIKQCLSTKIGEIENEIEQEENIQQIHVTIPSNFIQEFHSTVKKTMEEVLNDLNNIFSNNDNLSDIYDFDVCDIKVEEKILTASCQYINIVSNILAEKYFANIWRIFLLMKLKRFILEKEEDILGSISQLEYCNDEFVILNFGVWLDNNKLHNGNNGKIFTRNNVEIIDIQKNGKPIHSSLINSIIIIKRSDLPKINLNKTLDNRIQTKFRLKSFQNIYTSVIDLNDDSIQNIDDLRMEYRRYTENETRKYAMFCSYICSSLNYNSNAKILQLCVYNPFEHRTAPQKIDDINRFWKDDI